MAGKRRQFSREFKREAVRLIDEGGRSPGEVARDLGIRADMLRRWKRAEGKTHLAALRCLKRVLAGIVYYRLRAADQVLSSLDAESDPDAKIALAA